MKKYIIWISIIFLFFISIKTTVYSNNDETLE